MNITKLADKYRLYRESMTENAAGQLVSDTLPADQIWVVGSLVAALENHPVTVAETPNGREIRATPPGKFEIQPKNDNYWVEFPTLADAVEGYENPNLYPPSSILDSRVRWLGNGTPATVQREVQDLLSQRNDCEDALVGVIDAVILTMLRKRT